MSKKVKAAQRLTMEEASSAALNVADRLLEIEDVVGMIAVCSRAADENLSEEDRQLARTLDLIADRLESLVDVARRDANAVHEALKGEAK